eukprot:15435395-Alexandrium_andersonii.AAC.1
MSRDPTEPSGAWRARFHLICLRTPTLRDPVEPGGTQQNPAEPRGTRRTERNPADPGGTRWNLADEFRSEVRQFIKKCN